MTLNTLNTAGFSNLFFLFFVFNGLFPAYSHNFLLSKFFPWRRMLNVQNSKKKEQNIEQNLNQSGLEQLVDISFCS